MAYTPNPLDAAQPADSEDAATAAAEFRALKASLTSRLAGKAASGANTDIASLTGITGLIATGSFTVAGLPAGVNGRIAYASNGRKVGELAGAGTGVVVYYSGAAWRVFSTDAAVAA